jgi:hypothetical protein
MKKMVARFVRKISVKLSIGNFLELGIGLSGWTGLTKVVLWIKKLCQIDRLILA